MKNLLAKTLALPFLASLAIACSGAGTVELSCDMTDSCEEEIDPSVFTEEEPRCPEELPEAGSDCENNGRSCFYETDVNDCEYLALCVNRGWMVSTPACASPDGEVQDFGTAESEPTQTEESEPAQDEAQADDVQGDAGAAAPEESEENTAE